MLTCCPRVFHINSAFALQKQKEAQQAAEEAAATAAPSSKEADLPAAEEAGNRQNNLVHAWVLVQPGKREVGTATLPPAQPGPAEYIKQSWASQSARKCFTQINLCSHNLKC